MINNLNDESSSIMLKHFKKLPNQITLLRLLLIPFLYYFAYYNRRTFFTVFLIIVGLTDSLDGYLARKLKQESKFGVKFDSFADYVVYFSLIPWGYFLEKDFFVARFNIILILVVLFFLLQLTNLYVHRRFVFLHTRLGKTAAVVLFIMMVAGMIFGFSDLIFYIAYFTAVASLAEAIVLAVKSKGF